MLLIMNCRTPSVTPHDMAYEIADEKSEEPSSTARFDAKNAEDHGRVYEIVLRQFPRVCGITKIVGDVQA